MDVSIATVVISATVAGVTAIIVAVVNKHPSVLQKKKQEADIFDMVRVSLSRHISNLEGRIASNEASIGMLEGQKVEDRKQIEKLKRDNELCKYQHEVAKLEQAQIRKQMFHKELILETVFVLDDDKEDLEEFKEKFDPISVIHYRGFTDAKEFLRVAKEERPGIMVMDYNLGYTNAEEVLRQIEYEPEVFIISGLKGFQAKFKGKNVTFFHKDRDYVFEIAIAIIKYLNNKK